VLLTIDSSDLELQRQLILAQVDLAEAQLQLAEKGARVEDRASRREKMSKRQKRVWLKRKRISIESVNSGGNESIPQKQFDDARAILDVRQANYDGAVQAHQKLVSGSRPEEIAIAKAAKAQVEASLAIIDKKIHDCTILSPLQAHSDRETGGSGEMTTPGRNVLTLADLSTVKLRVYIKEERLPRVALDQMVDVRIDGSSVPFRGRVNFISDVAEFTPKTIQTEEERVKLVFAVEIEIDNPTEC